MKISQDVPHNYGSILPFNENHFMCRAESDWLCEHTGSTLLKAPKMWTMMPGLLFYGLAHSSIFFFLINFKAVNVL